MPKSECFFFKDEQNWQPKSASVINKVLTCPRAQTCWMLTCPALLTKSTKTLQLVGTVLLTTQLQPAFFLFVFFCSRAVTRRTFFLLVFFCSRAVTRRKQLKQSKCQCSLWWGRGGGQIVSGGRLSLKPEKQGESGRWDGGTESVSQNWKGGVGGGGAGGRNCLMIKSGGGGGLSPWEYKSVTYG